MTKTELNKMLFALTVLVAAATAQGAQTADDMTIGRFGSPPAETQTVSESRKTRSREGDDDACKCVPYYLCRDNDHSVPDRNFLSFEQNPCEETVEVCCKNPDSTVPKVVRETEDLKGCGYRFPNGVDYIPNLDNEQNSDNSNFGEFPWVVAFLETSNGSYVGSGAIIHPEVIVTAAHVISSYKDSPGNLKIRAGEWDFKTTMETYPHQEREAQQIKIHPDFHRRNLRNDIALIQLSEPLKFENHVNTICLPEQDESFDQSSGCLQTGWPRTSFNDSTPGIMNKVEMHMIPHSRCNDQLKMTRLSPLYMLHSSFVCSGGDDANICKLCGGAPLVCPSGGADRYKLVGLIAWSIGCNLIETPGMSVAVSNFRTWIDSQIKEWGYNNSSYI
ncbi:hypothetical protein K1T71_013778 [Dendrolimus kikuchii]|uniref:Uncharacterized protein n=1 Tax=Dendrolimus kikuchii TaxID=765133 RepID=A0ACC1CG39_9NEOP|nr:hypothetical protein K1T71_013778 [Dendrolimus kikuchii]